MFSFKLLATQVEGKNKKQKMKSERGNGRLDRNFTEWKWEFWAKEGHDLTIFHLMLSHFVFWPHHATCRILVPWPGIEPRPWHCKYRILTPGLPGNVLIWHILKGLFRLLFWEKPGREHAFKQGSQLGGDGNNTNERWQWLGQWWYQWERC